MVLLGVYLIHAYLRYKRNTLTGFGEKPAEARKLEPTKKAFLDAIEVDMLPSLAFFAVATAVGSFYFFMCLCFIMVIIGTILCAMGYARSSQDFVLAGRIIIVLGTFLAFFSLFGDNLVFDDKLIVDEVLER